MGLRKPKKPVKYDQPYLSEKITHFKVLVGYMHKFLYVFTDFKYQKCSMQRGPGFLHNFIIDYYNYLITTEK